MRYTLTQFPKVSVVTPSYNQGAYLAETLASVVEQRYPNLELIVIDGGSRDESVKVIERFKENIAYWVSEPDKGQSEAINKGFARATGEVVCWLNSDDVFLPGALNAIAHAFGSHPDWEWITAPSLKFGEGLHELSGFYELPGDRVEWLVHCPILQPSTFWRRSLYERLGGLDESFHYALDYEYWIRFVMNGVELRFLDRPLSAYRLHGESKTVAQSEKFLTEEARLREKYVGQLSAAERAKLKRLLGNSAAIDELVSAVGDLQDEQWSKARSRVLTVLKANPGLLFTRTGAASLFRVLAKKPRYGG